MMRSDMKRRYDDINRVAEALTLVGVAVLIALVIWGHA